MRLLLRRHALAVLGFAALALLVTWPLPLHLSSHLTGAPTGDTGVYVWNLWVFGHEVGAGRLPFHTSAILAIDPDTTDRVNLSLHNYTTFANLIALALVPAFGLVTAFNLVLLLNVTLTGYSTYLLTRDLGASPTASALGAVLFAASPVLVARSADHFSLVAAAPLPVFLLVLRRVVQTGYLRWSIALGAVVAWATFCDPYYGIFCLLIGAVALGARLVAVERTADVGPARRVGMLRVLDIVIVVFASFVFAMFLRGGGPVAILGLRISMRTLYTPMLVLTLLVGLRVVIALRPRLELRRDGWSRATLMPVVAATLAMAVLLAPVLVAFGQRLVSGGGPTSRTLWRSSPPGVDLLAFVLPSPTHPLWGEPFRARIVEWSGRADGYPEFVASVPLAALAVLLFAWMRGGWRPPPLYGGATVMFALMALGPFVHVAGVNTFLPTPWTLLRYVPVLGMVRSPSRFAVLATLGLAVLVALALTQLGRRFPERRRLLFLIVGLVLAVELWAAPRALHSAAIPSIYEVIARDPRDDIRVLELPFGVRDGTSSMGDFTARTQFYQTAHGKAIIGGYLSRVSPRRKRTYERLPVSSALLTLSEGAPLTPEQERLAREHVDRFLQRARLGYVVVDHQRASPRLVTFAIDLLGLTPVAREGSLELFVPRPVSRPDR